MRIPTSSYFQTQLDELNTQYDKISRLREQITTGNKLLQDSDDPVLANSIKSVADFINNLTNYQQNGVFLQSRLKLYDSVSSEIVSDISQIKDLIATASSDTLPASQHANIAKQLQVYLDQLMSCANTTDGAGNYIFSGMNYKTPSYVGTNNQYIYQGSMQGVNLDISPNSSVLYADSGFDVFGNIGLGNGTFTITTNPANQGTCYTFPGDVADTSNYVADTYTLTFVSNGDGKIRYQVTGTTSGQVIPPPPATSPTDAPEYIEGQSITFNGIEFACKGTPVVGDSMQIQPSTKDNIFNTIQNLIDLLNAPMDTDVAKANFHQALNQIGGTIDNAQQLFIQFESNIGIREQLANKQIALNTDTLTQQNIIFGNLSAVDETSAISAMSQDMIGLEATQKCYSQIQELLMMLLR